MPSWVWVALLGLLLAAVAATMLLLRARRRAAWRSEFRAATDEVAWFARTLLPQLQQAGSTDQMAGGWAVASERVTRAVEHLSPLEATAPDDLARGQVRLLRGSASDAQQEVDRLLSPGGPAVLPQDLEQIRLRLEAAIESATRQVF